MCGKTTHKIGRDRASEWEGKIETRTVLVRLLQAITVEHFMLFSYFFEQKFDHFIKDDLNCELFVHKRCWWKESWARQNSDTERRISYSDVIAKLYGDRHFLRQIIGKSEEKNATIDWIKFKHDRKLRARRKSTIKPVRRRSEDQKKHIPFGKMHAHSRCFCWSCISVLLKQKTKNVIVATMATIQLFTGFNVCVRVWLCVWEWVFSFQSINVNYRTILFRFVINFLFYFWLN